MIESILETMPFEFASAGGTISIPSASGAVTGVGTTFTNHAVGDLIEVTNDAGEVQHFEISVITDATNMTVSINARSVITAKSYRACTPASDYFYVDNTILKQPVMKAQSANNQHNVMFVDGFLAGVELTNISYHEGFLLKSIYARLPYQMTFADTDIQISMVTERITGGGADENITPLGEAGVFALPVENSEVPTNIYVPPDPDAVINEEAYEVFSTMDEGRTGLVVNPPATVPVGKEPAISMVNVPNILNGTIQPVIIGIRILHADIAMTA